MGPREGAVAVALLLCASCGRSDPLEDHQWWYLKPGRFIADRAWPEEPDAPPRSLGYRTIAWRIGAGDPLRFSIEWSDARSEHGAAIARIVGRLDAGRETRLHVSVRERPPSDRAISFTCARCGTQWREQGEASAAGARCPKCGEALEPSSSWHSVPTREVRIRAVPPIAELDAGPSFRREGDALVGAIDRRLVPAYGADFDVAPFVAPLLDGPIERAVPTDIALIFHLPPGERGECGGDGASYACECGGVRIEADASGYEITEGGRVIPLARYPLPVWRFSFRIER